MKATLFSTTILLLTPPLLASPINPTKRQDFSKIDYSNVDYSDVDFSNADVSSVDFSKIDYPPGTGENLPSYPPGTGENLPFYPTGTGRSPPTTFTTTFHIEATPDQVVNGTDNPFFTGGLEGATGFYDFQINSDLDIICFNIKLVGFRGEYQSPARTATHVHSALKGKNGPPRLAFPNPTGDGHERFSSGCLYGPFTTGLKMNGQDTGTGFKLSQIEANPSDFMADVHSSLAVPGAVRGQFP